ncbi:hypothetical protein [Streptomyces sp. NPDC094149]|uniref:hypothetical protein n=1 Tax=Streptomyces sp. NPDC094149 TaxID=3155079 RepID=UPI0033311440
MKKEPGEWNQRAAVENSASLPLVAATTSHQNGSRKYRIIATITTLTVTRPRAAD